MENRNQAEDRNHLREGQAAAHLPGAHLSDEQFTGLLLGANPPLVSAHLKACPQCAEEAERVSGAIAGFEQQSRAWAERRAASRPLLAFDRKPAFAWLQIAGSPQAWVAASLAIALAVGIGAGIRTELRISHRDNFAQTTAPQPVKAQPAAAVTPATLKADNELLSAIDGELSAEATPSPSVYGLTVSDHPVRSRPAKRIAN
jgi:nucleotide-binding universal stress UspA family protein